MTTIDIPCFKLANDIDIPVLGLGTYPMGKREVYRAVRTAERVGYTLFDTSSVYGNEIGIGLSLGKRGFVTTKVSNAAQRKGKVRKEVQASRVKLQRGVIDLILLHWPYPGKFADSWKMLEEFYREGICRSIGVANFKIHHLETLMESAEIVPMVNQFERHPMYAEKELTDWCKANGIVPEAYTPFARMDTRLFHDERLLRVSRKHNKNPTQIILRWNYQHRVVSIPKTSSPQRMKENASIFDFHLSESEMEILDSMDCGMRVRFDPDNCDFDKL